MLRAAKIIRLSRIGLLAIVVGAEDWFANPKAGEVVDFITYARTKVGLRAISPTRQPDEFLKQAQHESLEYCLQTVFC